ncbi:MAG: hypothetical protein ACXADY_19835 [Candidatus Hodarchaeales archaeon]|jgi:hypothetical protein
MNDCPFIPPLGLRKIELELDCYKSQLFLLLSLVTIKRENTELFIRITKLYFKLEMFYRDHEHSPISLGDFLKILRTSFSQFFVMTSDDPSYWWEYLPTPKEIPEDLLLHPVKPIFPESLLTKEIWKALTSLSNVEITLDMVENLLSSIPSTSNPIYTEMKDFTCFTFYVLLWGVLVNPFKIYFMRGTSRTYFTDFHDNKELYSLHSHLKEFISENRLAFIDFLKGKFEKLHEPINLHGILDYLDLTHLIGKRKFLISDLLKNDETMMKQIRYTLIKIKENLYDLRYYV